MTTADARALATWRYAGRYKVYDLVDEVRPEDGYWAVEDDGEVVGYCCFGKEARVRGVRAESGTVDVGYGLRPDLVGRGRGREFVAAIIRFATAEFAAARLRLLILEWNERSRSVAEAVGFRTDGTVRSEDRTFVVMSRAAEDARR
jgi:ribosomal-protein-alanine N-acetyltransferase